MTPNPTKSAGLAMRCMEIRGGSRFVAESLATPGLDAWVYSRPFEGDEHGGDIYYVSLCGGGLITRIVVADVSGHGARVADVSAALRDLMRRNINTKSQTRLVKALNREFGETARSIRFATAVVATYLANLRRLTICNAGHPRPLWYRAESGEWSWLDHGPDAQGNYPLGIDDDSPYRQFAVDLGPGDVVLFYTDALTEAADETGHLLGEDGLLDLVRRLDLSAPDQINAALLAAVERHRGGRPADDDVTLLTIVHNGEGPRALSIGEKVDVYAKVFGLKAV
jgi:serine phosphatase RsbU (regulator of sigma subunit)